MKGRHSGNGFVKSKRRQEKYKTYRSTGRREDNKLKKAMRTVKLLERKMNRMNRQSRDTAAIELHIQKLKKQFKI